MGIEEHIRATGADQAAKDIDRVADATEHAGDATDQAGGKAKHGADGFDDLGDSAGRAGGSFGDFAEKMSHGLLGFESLLQIASKFRAELERIVELQRELADQSTGALETVLPLAEQRRDVSQAGLEQSLKDVTTLRKKAVMSSLAAATSLALAADISLEGGFDPAEDAEAFARNLPIAAAVGGAIPLGTEATYQGIFELLKTGRITDPAKINTELARLLTIQQASQSASLASFVAGMASPGIKAFLGQGGSLSDAAVLLLQAREAATNDAQAATIADVVLRVSRGTTGTQDFLTRRSEELGFGRFETLTDAQRVQLLERIFVEASRGGPEAMTALQREGFEPGQFPLIVSTFSQTARETAGKARQAAAQASGADIAKKIKDFADSQIGLERTQQADIEYAEAAMGIDVYSISKLRELAEHRNKLRLARPGVRGGEIFESAITSDEALMEREAMGILGERIGVLADQGIDVTGALKAYARAERGGFLQIGVGNERLRQANEAVNAAIKQAGERALSGGPPVNVNVTQIGTNYSDTDPERNTPEPPYLGE